MILGVDLGTHLGWFLGNATGPCEWGTFELENTTNLGRWLRSSDAFWQEFLPLAHMIAIEKPNTGGNSAYFAIRKNMALMAHAHYWASFYDLSDITEVSVSTAKLTLAGHGHADKEQMIAAAAADGFVGMDEHAADAYGIWKVLVFGARAPIAKRRSKSGPMKRVTTT